LIKTATLRGGIIAKKQMKYITMMEGAYVKPYPPQKYSAKNYAKKLSHFGNDL